MRPRESAALRNQLSFGRGKPQEHIIFRVPKSSIATMRQIGWGATLVPAGSFLLAITYWTEPLRSDKAIAAAARMEKYGPLHGTRYRHQQPR